MGPSSNKREQDQATTTAEIEQKPMRLNEKETQLQSGGQNVEMTKNTQNVTTTMKMKNTT